MGVRILMSTELRGDHTIVPEQRVDARLAPAEGAERFRGRPAAADRENFVAEALPGARVEDAVFLEEGIGVRREHFRPLVAVVARGVAAREDVREAVRE